ncbi:BRO-N domain-containing protein [Variovorax sp. PBL-E5]|uniref:BRO-N domain-containing protein n=1 Tax=Variovorax sp. PBL-E5 TaxID=434014 RepID=UPI0018DA2A94|nr:BRO family protein [Variovorax sp. PBL-E5]
MIAEIFYFDQVHGPPEGAGVRAVDIDGEPYFVGKDVAATLGYANETDAMNTHCRGVAKRYPIPDALGRLQDTRVISEPDMLRLIVNSTLLGVPPFGRAMPSERISSGWSISWKSAPMTKRTRCSLKFQRAVPSGRWCT